MVRSFAGTVLTGSCLLIGLLVATTTSFGQPKKIKVACIGNSITFGLKHLNPDSTSYPTVLQKLLGSQYRVENFGHSGATVLRKGHNPYIKCKPFADAIAMIPDVVIIELGLNDTDPRNWPNYHDDFIGDLHFLIDTFRSLNQGVKIYLTTLTPIFPDHPRFLSGTRDWFWRIQDVLPQIAKYANAELIDFHSGLYRRPDLFLDAVHPNEEGAAILAKMAYQKITGDYGGLTLGAPFQSHMVIQRGRPVIFYGTANNAEKVSIRFNNLLRLDTATADGMWKIEFPALPAGGPYSATITTKNRSIVVEDIMLGDVWLCSGQSNMVFPLQSANHTEGDMRYAEKMSSIRLWNLKVLAETNNSSWDSTTLRKVDELKYFSGTWQRCDSSRAKDFSAIGFFFGQQLYNKLQVPIGLIQVAVGGSPTESWIDRFTLEHHPLLVNELKNWQNSDFFQPWVRERAGLNLKLASNPKQRHPYEPSYNFEAGVDALTSFPIKGVIWYQGESNTHNIELHEQLFPVLVNSWREKWGYEFPFYYVQLSSIDRPSWPHFRFSQSSFIHKLPHTGMAVSSDVGDSLNVHPAQKKEVGERLARLALHFSYGKKEVVPYGPTPITARVENKKIVVQFRYGKGLQTNDGLPLRGLSVVDEKGCTVDVAARIINDEVVIFLCGLDGATHVRYAWKPFTRANLVNDAGLPTSTFTIPIK